MSAACRIPWEAPWKLFYRIIDNKVEALEFSVKKDSRVPLMFPLSQLEAEEKSAAVQYYQKRKDYPALRTGHD